jgi:hypothetical protein
MKIDIAMLEAHTFRSFNAISFGCRSASTAVQSLLEAKEGGGFLHRLWSDACTRSSHRLGGVTIHEAKSRFSARKRC